MKTFVIQAALAFLVILTLVLVACGGGGSGGTPRETGDDDDLLGDDDDSGDGDDDDTPDSARALGWFVGTSETVWGALYHFDGLDVNEVSHKNLETFETGFMASETFGWAVGRGVVYELADGAWQELEGAPECGGWHAWPWLFDDGTAYLPCHSKDDRVIYYFDGAFWQEAASVPQSKYFTCLSKTECFAWYYNYNEGSPYGDDDDDDTYEELDVGYLFDGTSATQVPDPPGDMQIRDAVVWDGGAILGLLYDSVTEVYELHEFRDGDWDDDVFFDPDAGFFYLAHLEPINDGRAALAWAAGNEHGTYILKTDGSFISNDWPYLAQVVFVAEESGVAKYLDGHNHKIVGISASGMWTIHDGAALPYSLGNDFLVAARAEP